MKKHGVPNWETDGLAKHLGGRAYADVSHRINRSDIEAVLGSLVDTELRLEGLARGNKEGGK